LNNVLPTQYGKVGCIFGQTATPLKRSVFDIFLSLPLPTTEILSPSVQHVPGSAKRERERERESERERAVTSEADLVAG
jgi:hypothetical protein